jgi:D-amino-acid oxidase
MSLANGSPSMLWKDISPEPFPLVQPGPDSRHVLVVGGGVTGLVTAWMLLDHG